MDNPSGIAGKHASSHRYGGICRTFSSNCSRNEIKESTCGAGSLSTSLGIGCSASGGNTPIVKLLGLCRDSIGVTLTCGLSSQLLILPTLAMARVQVCGSVKSAALSSSTALIKRRRKISLSTCTSSRPSYIPVSLLNDNVGSFSSIFHLTYFPTPARTSVLQYRA